MNSPLVRLLVVHWNQPEACAATVRALQAQDLPLRTTVIDNHSETEAFEHLQSGLGDIAEVVRLEQNRGWGGALNIILQPWLREEATPYCLLSAHDTALEPDCLRRLLAAAEADPQIGIACPQYPEPFVARLSRRRGVFPTTVEPRPAGYVQQVDVPHGTLMLVRRECLEQIGLFDERYFAYGDEHELGARAGRRGWKVALVWGAVVINPSTRTASALRSYLFARNSLLLVHDYFGRVAAWTRAILLLGNTLRLVTLAREDDCFSARARWRGVRDYFTGRFGRPIFF